MRERQSEDESKVPILHFTMSKHTIVNRMQYTDSLFITYL